MKLWTYAEARDKALVDSDLQDQSFVTPDEMIGYFNDGIEEAESHIHKLDEDYFLTQAPVPLVTGTRTYAFPYNCYGFKLRGIQYANGSDIYPVKRFRRYNKFETIAESRQSNASDPYRWFFTHDGPGEAYINLEPPARETAILPPLTGSFTPMVAWYLRSANRIPLLGEYVKRYETRDASLTISVAANTLTVAKTYVTGNQVKLSTTGTMPGGLTAGTVYFVILATSTTIKFAATRALALAGTAIDITSLGSGLLYVDLAATQTIIDNTLIDIPEFTRFAIQFARCKAMLKEGDPRLSAETVLLDGLRDGMIATLKESQQDDENLVEMDLSSYEEMS